MYSLDVKESYPSWRALSGHVRFHKTKTIQDDYNRKNGLPVTGPIPVPGCSGELNPDYVEEDVDKRLAEIGVEINDGDVDRLVGILEEENMSNRRKNEKICSSAESFLTFTQGFNSHNSFLPIINTSASINHDFNVTNVFTSKSADGAGCVVECDSGHPQVSTDTLPADCSGNSSPRPTTDIGDDVVLLLKKKFVILMSLRRKGALRLMCPTLAQ